MTLFQFVGSRVGSPVISKPVAENEVSGDVNLSVPNGVNGKNIIQALESQADEM